MLCERVAGAGVREIRAHEGRSLPVEQFCVHWQLPRTSLRVCRPRWYYPPCGACAAAVRNLSCRRCRQAPFHARSVGNLQRGNYYRPCGIIAIALRSHTSSMRPPHSTQDQRQTAVTLTFLFPYQKSTSGGARPHSARGGGERDEESHADQNTTVYASPTAPTSHRSLYAASVSHVRRGLRLTEPAARAGSAQASAVSALSCPVTETSET